jgi:hypothetical protein
VAGCGGYKKDIRGYLGKVFVHRGKRLKLDARGSTFNWTLGNPQHSDPAYLLYCHWAGEDHERSKSPRGGATTANDNVSNIYRFIATGIPSTTVLYHKAICFCLCFFWLRGTAVDWSSQPQHALCFIGRKELFCCISSEHGVIPWLFEVLGAVFRSLLEKGYSF